MCHAAVSMQSQQDELIISLCHVEGAVPGSHGLRAAFPGEETVVPQLIPILWLDFSPVTRGVGGQAWLSSERAESTDSCGIYPAAPPLPCCLGLTAGAKPSSLSEGERVILTNRIS